MNSFTVLLLCVQACLLQDVFGQCYGSYGPEVFNNAGQYGAGIPLAPASISLGNRCGATSGYGAVGLGNAGYGFGSPVSAGFGYGSGFGNAAYGGAGEGNVAVAGELPVAGNTAVAGQVPISGAVSFGGNVPAAGSVAINGNCACSCGY